MTTTRRSVETQTPEERPHPHHISAACSLRPHGTEASTLGASSFPSSCQRPAAQTLARMEDIPRDEPKEAPRGRWPDVMQDFPCPVSPCSSLTLLLFADFLGEIRQR
jgi:hypothetical protein